MFIGIRGSCKLFSIDHLYCTVGVHPTRCGEFERTEGMTPQHYMEELVAMISKNKDKVIAIGECGLGK